MKKQLLVILVLGLLTMTSCSKYFAQYDDTQFYRHTEEINSDLRDNIKYRIVHAYGPYYFLEVLVYLPTEDGDTIKQWVPVEKFERNRDMYITPEPPVKKHKIRYIDTVPEPEKVWAER